MVAPHELRKKEFSRTMRGYSTSEVDEYISYLIKNYVDLYRQNTELEKKLNAVLKENSELSRDSYAVREALLDAQKAADKIIGDATEEAQIIVSSSKRNCDNILNEFRVLFAHEKEKLTAVQNAIVDFRTKLFAEYQEHIDRIDGLTELTDWSELDEDDEVFMHRVVEDIKTDIAFAMSERRSKSVDIPVSDDAPDPELFDAANKAEQAEETPAEQPVTELSDLPIEPDAPIDDPSATRTFDLAGDEIAMEFIPTDDAQDDASDPIPEPVEPEAAPAEAEPEEVPAQKNYDEVLEEFADDLAKELEQGAEEK